MITGNGVAFENLVTAASDLDYIAWLVKDDYIDHQHAEDVVDHHHGEDVVKGGYGEHVADKHPDMHINQYRL